MARGFRPVYIVPRHPSRPSAPRLQPQLMNAIFCSPNRYTQGVNSTETIGLEMTRLGLSGSVLIVAGRSARRLLEPVWRKSLADCGFDFHILDFAGESTRAEVERIAAAARSSQATIILAAGGGKAIDAARAAATDLALPMVSCPTIASNRFLAGTASSRRRLNCGSTWTWRLKTWSRTGSHCWT